MMTYGTPLIVHSGQNRKERRKAAKIARLGLRDWPGSQWSRDRARHREHMIAGWRK